MHARVVLGVGKGVLFREVSSIQEHPYIYHAGNLQCTPLHTVFSNTCTSDVYIYRVTALM